MQLKPEEILKAFRPGRILWPILIGLLVASYLLFRNFDAKAFGEINWSTHLVFWLIVSVIMMVIRDLAYMYRIRVLTDKHLSWKQSFDVILLWEFASAVTPSIVGGTAFALLLLHKENISAGRSTAIVLVSTFLDELFFVLMVPILYFTVGHHALFNPLNAEALQSFTHGNGMFYFFSVGYVIIFVYTVFLAYGIFINPRGLKWLLIKLFSLPILRKKRNEAREAGADLVIASLELRNVGKGYWIKSFGATFVSWTARYLVVNCLILAFVAGGDQFLIYARQLVMWIIMLISPTPGGSGIAELVFSSFLSDFIPQGLTTPLGIMWRLISYYPYLFIGAILLPRWIRRKFLITKTAS